VTGTYGNNSLLGVLGAVTGGNVTGNTVTPIYIYIYIIIIIIVTAQAVTGNKDRVRLGGSMKH
jgi:hypothetical protein